MLWVNFLDARNIIIGLLPVLLFSVFWGIYRLAYIIAFPMIITYKVLTPWKEDQGETPLMWWVDAIELGLTNPMDPPGNFFEIEDARVQYLSRYEDIE